MVDVEGGNNMLYLPLDRMGSQQGGIAGDVNRESVDDIVDAILRELNDRAAASRRRDNR